MQPPPSDAQLVDFLSSEVPALAELYDRFAHAIDPFDEGRDLVLHFINTLTFVAPDLAGGKARGGRIPHSGSVTDEQRSRRQNSAQPSGRQFFFGQTSLLAPYRSISDMRVARA